MELPAPAGLGCARLSTQPERDEARALAALHAALDGGVRFLDTADAYCLDQTEAGHNERLVARALRTWNGDAASVTVATKGGLTRPGGKWVPDGRARHIEAACDASRAALGTECIDLYFLHAVDPRTALATSVRALARLRARGWVRRIGLSNVTLGQLLEASKITDIDAVQVAMSPLDLSAIRSGVAEHCVQRGLMLVAHSPLGGPRGAARLSRHAALGAVAAPRGVSPVEITLGWLRGLAPVIVTIPGASTPESARSAARAQTMTLDERERASLDEAFPAARQLRMPRERRQPGLGATGEVVLIMGCPAAGKSTLAEAFTAQGYERLNRDLAGGRLRDLIAPLERGLAAGRRRFVLDNTYPTRVARNEVIETAWRHGVPVRCLWLQTSLEEAQVNAVQRILARLGRLPGPQEMSELARRDPGILPPRALFNYQRLLELPALDEGFSSIEARPFERRRGEGCTNRAIIFEYQTVRDQPARVEVLRRCREAGWLLMGLAWLPEIARGTLREDDAVRALQALHSDLGMDGEPLWCPHGPGPAACWCRPPLPGLGVALIERHRLESGRCIFVGTSTGGTGGVALARRLSFRYADAATFFTAPPLEP